MKILHVITGLGCGGAERLLLEMAQENKAQGATTTRILYLKNDTYLLCQYPSIRNDCTCLHFSKNPLSWPPAILAFVRFIRAFRPDVIHAHMFHSLIVSLFAKLTKSKSIIVFTSHTYVVASMRSLLIQATKLFRHADIVFSKNQHLHLNNKSCYLIPNGINTTNEKFQPANKGGATKTVLFVGGLRPEKNPIRAITVFNDLKDKNSQLVIAGGGRLEMECRRKIESLNITNRVVMLGISSNVRELMRSANVLLISSNWEGMPLVALEAGICGLPIVATPVGAIPDLLNNNHGFVSRPEAMSEVIDRIFADPNEAEQRARNFFDLVIKNHSTSRVLSQHIKLYSNLITQ